MSRPRAGYIGFNRVPAASAVNSAASGVWSLREAEQAKRAGTWPSASVNPTSITGLQLWLDASDASTLYDATSGGSLVAANGGVARWEDKSGNARHATQGTAGSRPTRKTAIQGGRDVLRFDGSDDWLTSADVADLSSGTAITCFCVVKRAATGSGHTIIAKYERTPDQTSAEDGWLFRFFDSNVLNAAFGRDGSYSQQTTTSAVTASSFSSLSFKATAGSLTTLTAIYQNGVALASTSSGGVQTLDNTTYPITIGVQRYAGVSYDLFNGDIAEIMIYNSALSDADRSAVDLYFTTKWGIS
jgi:hypothetical protein